MVEDLGAPPSTWTDKAAWQEILLYSRTVADHHYCGSQLFFTQLVDVGPAFVTYGSIIPFRGLEKADVLFLADVVQHANRPPASIPLLGVTDPARPVGDSP